MNLDDLTYFSSIDPQHMLALIDGLPDQLEAAWDLGSRQSLPAWKGIRQVVIAGMGGSAIGGDLLAAYLESTSRVPLIVHRDYDLPAFARGPETLVIASSHSGNTEETLTAFQRAREGACRILAVCTGGKLAQSAGESGVPVWRFEHKGQPRSAVGFSFGLLLAALSRLGFIPDPEKELTEALAAMRAQQARLRADVPVVQNPAKRIAGQLMGRWVTVFGAGVLFQSPGAGKASSMSSPKPGDSSTCCPKPSTIPWRVSSILKNTCRAWWHFSYAVQQIDRVTGYVWTLPAKPSCSKASTQIISMLRGMLRWQTNGLPCISAITQPTTWRWHMA